MKQILFYLSLLLCYSVAGQNDFTGIIKYKITVEGSDNSATDSMAIVFSRQKVKVILYLPDSQSTGGVSEKIFIDDFSAKRNITLNTKDKSFKSDTLKALLKYNFINTYQIAAVNNILCFKYIADSTKFDKAVISGVSCLASIDHRNSFLSNYYFLGIQPVIINNRIVMDYTVTQPGGVAQKIYVSGIKKLEDVESNFDLADYKQVN